VILSNRSTHNSITTSRREPSSSCNHIHPPRPRGITVNNVQPGTIDTDLSPVSGEGAAGQKAVDPLDRYGHVDEVAMLVAFIAGPESSYINGANLTVDGGTNA
jgi:NAD(P)-dependent dehydrogenase (short-subunit alcohol dehydrogenase family)